MLIFVSNSRATSAVDMITPKELTDKLQLIPEAKPLFDQMADRSLWDSAYVLLGNEYRLNNIEYEAGLRNAPFVNDPTAQPVPPWTYIGPRLVIVRFNPHEMMLVRLRAIHPGASDDRLLEAIEAASAPSPRGKDELSATET